MTALQASSQQHLRQFIEQIERLEEEKAATAADIRAKYAEAKALGFDPKTMRKIVALRKKPKTDRAEKQAILETYMHALGMLDGTPMGDHLADQKPMITEGEKAVALLRDAEDRGASLIQYGGGVWSVGMFRGVLVEMGLVEHKPEAKAEPAPPPQPEPEAEPTKISARVGDDDPPSAPTPQVPAKLGRRTPSRIARERPTNTSRATARLSPDTAPAAAGRGDQNLRTEAAE